MPKIYCMECGGENFYKTTKPYSCSSCSAELGKPSVAMSPARPEDRKKAVRVLPKSDRSRRRREPEEDTEVWAEDDDDDYFDLEPINPNEGVVISASKGRSNLGDLVSNKKPNVSRNRASREESQRKLENLRNRVKNVEGSEEINP